MAYATEKQESQSTELVTVPSKETALQVFKTEKGLDPYLQTIRQELDNFMASPPSLDTATGRKAYASMAHKIARSKTAIDALGKELVSDLKELPRTIDAERKRWRDQLDQWRDEARSPLSDWEAREEKRVAAHQEQIALIESWAVNEDDNGGRLNSFCLKDALIKVESVKIGDHWEEFEAKAARAKETAIENLKFFIASQEKYESEQAELERFRKEKAEREQKEREDRIAREAEERARREAEEKAAAEREAVAKREQIAKEEAERREREHQEAIDKAKREAEQERQRIQDEYKRKEEERLAEKRRQQEEVERRQADKKNRAAINRAAMKAMTDGGLTEECAKQAVTLIAKGQVPGVTINY